MTFAHEYIAHLWCVCYLLNKMKFTTCIAAITSEKKIIEMAGILFYDAH